MSKGLFLLLIFYSFQSFSQPYYNSWIVQSQQYYKFKIASTGLYRIDSLTLYNSGIPINSIDPRNIQVFARGQEIPIFINGENDGFFNDGDFIEFYGQKNDGWFDEPFYGTAAKHPNPYYSLINDTINYFLTWNSSLSNARYTLENDTNYTSYSPSLYFEKEILNAYSSSYSTGKTLAIGGDSENLFGYDSAEGWFDTPYTIGSGTTKQ